MITKVCVLVLALFVNFRVLRACNGYTFKLNSVKNCVDNSVIKVNPDFDITMDNDCNLKVVGCVNITKPIKTATGTYRLKKAPLPTLEGEMDFCNSISDYNIPAISDTLASFGLASKCPYQAKKHCAVPKNIDISGFKNQLALAAGTTEMRFDVEHDTGRTCVESKFTFSKPRRG